MPSVRTLRGYLARAETQIAVDRARIAQQAAWVEWLREAGNDTNQAVRRLGHLRISLECWQEHRTEILEAIARLTN